MTLEQQIELANKQNKELKKEIDTLNKKLKFKTNLITSLAELINTTNKHKVKGGFRL